MRTMKPGYEILEAYNNQNADAGFLTLEEMIFQAQESAYEEGRLDLLYANEYVILQLTKEQAYLVQSSVKAMSHFCQLSAKEKEVDFDVIEKILFRAIADFNRKAVSA